MKAADRYLKYVRWEAEDAKYVGYCPDLFPWGGVCHGETEEETYGQLCRLVEEEVSELQREGEPCPNLRPGRCEKRYFRVEAWMHAIGAARPRLIQIGGRRPPLQ